MLDALISRGLIQGLVSRSFNLCFESDYNIRAISQERALFYVL